MTWEHQNKKTARKWNRLFCAYHMNLRRGLLIHVGCYYNDKKVFLFCIILQFLRSLTPPAEAVMCHIDKWRLPPWNLKSKFLHWTLSMFPQYVALDTDESLLLKAQPADAGHDMEVCLSRECIMEACSEWEPHVCTQTCEEFQWFLEFVTARRCLPSQLRLRTALMCKQYF